MSEPSRRRSRAEYERGRPDYSAGLPDHHDPTAGIGGAAPAQSALTLRLVLAAFGLVVCVAGGIVLLAAGVPAVVAVVLFVLAAVALVDLVVVARRKARGEPG
jgi:Flp pilus assembly protein TadB